MCVESEVALRILFVSRTSTLAAKVLVLSHISNVHHISILPIVMAASSGEKRALFCFFSFLS